MTTVTLTAPDGYQERWDVETTYHALKLWNAYINNPDQQRPNELATLIGRFVGSNPKEVHAELVYIQSIRAGLFRKLSNLSENEDKNIPRLLFVMKSLQENSHYLPHNQHKEHGRKRLIKHIKEETNNDQATLNGLIDLAQLFVDGLLSYESK